MHDKDIMLLALAHYQIAAHEVVEEYGRWEAWAHEMRRVISGFRSSTDVLRFAQDSRKVPFTHREPFNRDLMNVYCKMIRSDFPNLARKFETISDNPRSATETLGPWVNGTGHISNMMIWHCWSILACQTWIGKISSIIEIGGGYGAMARLWCQNFPINRYVIVDIPESLYFAEVCLRADFGNEVGYFHGSDPGTKIILVPVNEFKKTAITAADLVVNVGSMQEMSDEWVDYYMRWLDESDAKYFYSLNYAAQPIIEMKESRCYWGPKLSPKWSTKELIFNPALIRIMCYERNFLAALYCKEPAQETLNDWSVFRGHLLTTQTFVEGLDLLRQKPTNEYIKAFLETVVRQQQSLGYIPKELVALVDLVDCKASRTVRALVDSNPKNFVD